MSDHACRTDRSSGDWKDERLTDVSRAEAFRTTAVRISVVNSWRPAEAMNETLLSINASSPSRSDREWTGCARTGEGEVATATESRARACCPAAHSALISSADVSCSARSASSTRRWFNSRRQRRRSVVSRAAVSRRRACSRRISADEESVHPGGGSAHSVSDHGTGLRGPLVLF